MCPQLDRDYAYLPRLNFFRQKSLSGHRLTILRARKIMFRHSIPAREQSSLLACGHRFRDAQVGAPSWNRTNINGLEVRYFIH